MQVVVNGENRILPHGCQLAVALQEWGYSSAMPMAVAVNNQVIPKQDHERFILMAGHQIEILMPMQGG